MDELTNGDGQADMVFRPYYQGDDDDDDCDTRSMCSTYSKYKPATMGSFMVPRPTAKQSVLSSQNIQSMYQEFSHNSTVAKADMKHIVDYCNSL